MYTQIQNLHANLVFVFIQSCLVSHLQSAFDVNFSSVLEGKKGKALVVKEDLKRSPVFSAKWKFLSNGTWHWIPRFSPSPPLKLFCSTLLFCHIDFNTSFIRNADRCVLLCLCVCVCVWERERVSWDTYRLEYIFHWHKSYLEESVTEVSWMSL